MFREYIPSTYMHNVSCNSRVLSSARKQAACKKGKWWDNLHAVTLRIFRQPYKSGSGNVFHLLSYKSSLLCKHVVLAADTGKQNETQIMLFPFQESTGKWLREKCENREPQYLKSFLVSWWILYEHLLCNVW